MGSNPFIGVIYHWIGGLASASCYIPYKGIRRWAWETYWIIQGFFSWIIAPILVASIFVPNVIGILHASSARSLALTYFWGLLWGLGGLTFGLTVRYLGIALGYAIALGLCTAFGTLMPPLFSGTLGAIAHEHSGQVILFGVFICMVGIFISGLAGVHKERELSDEQKKRTVREFNFGKGLLVAIFSGVMSACFAYGLAAGKPIAQIAQRQLAHSGRLDLWQNLPVLIVVVLGGFTTNLIWCVTLMIRNRSASDLIRTTVMEPTSEPLLPAAQSVGAAAARMERRVRVPLAMNYFLSALGGVIWYFQFFFYSMGQTKMGKYDFSSWTLHMASIIIFSTLWGVSFKEWNGTSRYTKVLVALGLLVLVGSTVIVGYGSFLKANAPAF